MFLTHLECTECGTHQETTGLRTLCACGAPLVARYDLAGAGTALSRAALAARHGSMWRFRELLPVPRDREPVTLGEGGTPLLPLARTARRLGLERLMVKDEALNPTGSFKARGMSAAVSMALVHGARALAAPSAGNAGGALAAYGARAGLPVFLAMPKDVPAANRLEAEACGARVELIEGTIAHCGRWIREHAAENGWFDLSTLKEPYRVEGKKTMGYEIAEQLGWRLPDVILYPAGGGTGLVGMWKAFEEMRELGWIGADSKLPRMVAVQAEGCAPIVVGFALGLDRGQPPAEPHTVAAGLRVPTPIGDRWMLRVIRQSGGSAVAVPDQALVEGALRLARDEGIFACPEGGACLAALEILVAQGDVRRDESVVLFNTGTGLKYLECFAP